MHSCPHRFPAAGRQARRGFTLAELLAVVIIMAILTAVSLPSIIGMSRGASMRSAAAQVRSDLALARQTAITRRDNVGVYFPTINNSAAVISNYAYRAYIIAGERSGILTDFHFLPQGVLCEFSSATPVTEVDFPYPKPSPIVMKAKAVRFKRNGALATGASSLNLWLYEGVMLNNLPTSKLKFTNMVEVTGLTGSIYVNTP